MLDSLMKLWPPIGISPSSLFVSLAILSKYQHLFSPLSLMTVSTLSRNLESSARGSNAAAKKYAAMKQDKDNYFPSNKKQYEANMHKNSEEFKQLGTLANENRTADYYPLDKPQPKIY